MLHNKNEYMLIKDQQSMKGDNMSIASTLVPTNTDIGNGKAYSVSPSTRRDSVIYERPSSINLLYRRISSSIKRNFHDNIQSKREARREFRREKKPQDGKTNPME
ncbi:hypothetical protein INT48_004385 [Thamnidium elegans]|uniref:Uncharacterized protein n=1 Tax=Thamnidium elegans TaxID=101142 RepID=A0A8H7SRF4_9FUNG|nr:hypothetical protein INT48_004385 [Thamnidium elegans]